MTDHFHLLFAPLVFPNVFLEVGACGVVVLGLGVLGWGRDRRLGDRLGFVRLDFRWGLEYFSGFGDRVGCVFDLCAGLVELSE